LLEHLSVDVTKIDNTEQDVKVWIGFNWLSIFFRQAFVNRVMKILGSKKAGIILTMEFRVICIKLII